MTLIYFEFLGKFSDINWEDNILTKDYWLRIWDRYNINYYVVYVIVCICKS